MNFQHETTKEVVPVPTIKEKENRVFIQWFANVSEKVQFFFDTGYTSRDLLWNDKIDSFRVVFIGKAKDWPKAGALEFWFEQTGNGKDTPIVWLLSPFGNKLFKPVSPLLTLVPLGSPRAGIIIPRTYFDLTVRDKIMKEVEESSLRNQVFINPKANLPSEEIPWKDEYPECKCVEELGNSYDGNPGVPWRGSSQDFSHLCKRCGRRWWQYNIYYHLWKHVTNPEEWDVIRREAILKDAGYI